MSIRSGYRTIRWIGGRAWDARLWRPTHAGLVWRHLVYRNRNRDAGLGDRAHLLGAVQWLERAQDRSGDGGVAGRYLLGQGWTSSYPETTGYIIPTFIALARELGVGAFLERAQRAVDFLLPLQFPDGGFPGGEVRENANGPSIFNTAQILGGLLAWHAISRDDRALDAAARAGNWLVATQSPDGAWRTHTYNQVTATYFSHASCWLAELGQTTGESSYLNAAARHLDWVLGHQDPETGWFDRCGFSLEEHELRQAVTHTIAYTLWGVLATSEILRRSDGVEAVAKAAARMARRLELSGRLPGILDHCWRPQAPFTCLAGNAQTALVWLRLHALRGDARYLNVALKALDHIKAAQPMSSANAGIHGGIPGSYPLWGDYIYLGLTSWGAKFFVDALIAKRKALSTIRDDTSTDPESDRQIADHVPQSLPDVPERSARCPVKIIMYTVARSDKVPRMVTAWSAWGFKPAAVVVERRPEPTLIARLLRRIQDDGFGWVLSRLRHRTRDPEGVPADGAKAGDLASVCGQYGIPLVKVGPLDAPESIAAISQLRPDLAIHAGAGILRAPLLAIPRLGTVNAHMGLLPHYRGMNVAEWSVWEGAPVGCTVHLIDAGIDTGDILCVRRVSTTGVRDIQALRARVDEAQIGLLGDVVRFIVDTRGLPPRYRQTAGEGRQFFRMHGQIAAALQARLEGGASQTHRLDLTAVPDDRLAVSTG